MSGLAVRQIAKDRFAYASRPQMRPADGARPSYLRPVPPVSMDDSVTARLQAIGTKMTYARGKTIVHDGDASAYVFKVVSGALRAVRLLPDGRRAITGFRLPGDFFGFTDSAQSADAIEAVSDTTVIRYARPAFEAVLQADAQASRHFFDIVCKELCAAQDRLLTLGRKNAIERLATFLLAMADRGGVPGGRLEVELPMTRADMADYLGLTIETVSRVLTTLRNLRVIRLLSTTHVIFTDREELEAIRDAEGHAAQAACG